MDLGTFPHFLQFIERLLRHECNEIYILNNGYREAYSNKQFGLASHYLEFYMRAAELPPSLFKFMHEFRKQYSNEPHRLTEIAVLSQLDENIIGISRDNNIVDFLSNLDETTASNIRRLNNARQDRASFTRDVMEDVLWLDKPLTFNWFNGHLFSATYRNTNYIFFEFAYFDFLSSFMGERYAKGTAPIEAEYNYYYGY